MKLCPSSQDARLILLELWLRIGRSLLPKIPPFGISAGWIIQGNGSSCKCLNGRVIYLDEIRQDLGRNESAGSREKDKSLGFGHCDFLPLPIYLLGEYGLLFPLYIGEVSPGSEPPEDPSIERR